MWKFKIIVLVVLILFIVPVGLSGQKSSQLIQPPINNTIKQLFYVPDHQSKVDSIKDFISNNQEHPSEKIYLHVDRTNYLQGDTIWFKAYLWYGPEQLLDSISGILYVDLVNDQGIIAQKRRLLIQNGTSHGDFSLDTTISPGNYSLRAYTRLMQNMNSGEPFYQAVTINPVKQNFQFDFVPVIIKQTGNDSLRVGLRFFEIDQLGNLNNSYSHTIRYSIKIGDQLFQIDSILAENTKEHLLKYSLVGLRTQDSIAEFRITISDDRLTFEKKFRIPLQENIDLQFFPEGGNLVNGLESKIAFKAIGADGLGKEIDGEIRTDEETVVSGFKSTHKGMGAFMLKPLAKKKYFAHFWYNNQKYIVPLPIVSEEGSIMSVNFTGNNKDPFLLIKQVGSRAITSKYVVGSSYGKIWFSTHVKTFMDSCKIQIPVELIPEGVCRLTVLSASFEPECERLIYVDKNQRFKIEVIPDSSSYGKRSKVTLLIKATGLDGTPIQTDLSLAVLDKEQLIKNSEVHGISAYKLLESELKGHIEDADFYFKDDCTTNKVALDLLLLTQGYRKFLINNRSPKELQFDAEKNFNISGKIKFNGSKKQENKFDYRDIGLLLICGSKNSYLGQSKPDSLGKFKFQISLMHGKSHAMLQATTPKKEPFNGEIILDNPVSPPQFATLPSFSYSLASSSVEYIKGVQAVKKTEISKIPLYSSMSINLGEVVVTAKAKAKNWWRNYDKDAIKIANLDSLDPGGNRYKNIYDLLVEEYGAIWYNKNGLKSILLPIIRLAGRGGSYWFPIYVIDGKKYWNGEGFDFTPLETLSSFHVDAIKRILIIPPGKAIGMYYAYDPIIGFPQFILQSVVIIETYSNNIYRGDPQGIKTFMLDGLDAQRVFYSPRYEGPLKNSPIYDGRATILWEPSISTDANGQAKVEFYTSDRRTSLEVIAKGIEVENGYPGQVNSEINSNLKRLVK
jgi:hypothetical protein